MILRAAKQFAALRLLKKIELFAKRQRNLAHERFALDKFNVLISFVWGVSSPSSVCF